MSNCEACGHDADAHRPSEPLPGWPVLCGEPIEWGDTCLCDGRGRKTYGLYIRASMIFGPETATEWWNGSNDYLDGARPVDLLTLGRLDEIEAALVAAEQEGWGS